MPFSSAKKIKLEFVSYQHLFPPQSVNNDKQGLPIYKMTMCVNGEANSEGTPWALPSVRYTMAT